MLSPLIAAWPGATRSQCSIKSSNKCVWQKLYAAAKGPGDPAGSRHTSYSAASVLQCLCHSTGLLAQGRAGRLSSTAPPRTPAQRPSVPLGTEPPTPGERGEQVAVPRQRRRRRGSARWAAAAAGSRNPSWKQRPREQQKQKQQQKRRRRRQRRRRRHRVPFRTPARQEGRWRRRRR